MSVAETTTAQVVDHKAFRDVVGRFASGVTVITTSVDGKSFGTTASAMSSLSMDPPMLLVCLNKTSETGAAVFKAQSFAVNILADAQEHLAAKFAICQLRLNLLLLNHFAAPTQSFRSLNPTKNPEAFSASGLVCFARWLNRPLRPWTGNANNINAADDGAGGQHRND